jgi:hypothetical protein
VPFHSWARLDLEHRKALVPACKLSYRAVAADKFSMEKKFAVLSSFVGRFRLLLKGFVGTNSSPLTVLAQVATIVVCVLTIVGLVAQVR